MDTQKPLIIESPFGEHPVDTDGSPIGVVRMDPAASYVETGERLQKFINHADQDSWNMIRAGIDYVYKNLDLALGPLEDETGFGQKIKSRLEKGQKLFFKPNLVNIGSINPLTHGPDYGSKACTEWPFIAALMRWFHDRMDISYHQMAVGEAATTMPAFADYYTGINEDGKTVTPEAVVEGRVENFYGGWGFYFARKYLAESLEPGASDDPMKGFDESISGTYLPPGHVNDKLIVYDLNRIHDDVSKGREIKVPDGVNFKSITIHKAVVGGDPEDLEDMEAYPGCVLVNVPKLKVHIFALFTNAIKNLGIGLYPMQFARKGNNEWDYSMPHTAMPGMKGGVPHSNWVAEIDPGTCIPKRDDEGNFIVKKTGGLDATMIDIIKAVSAQDLFMIHIVDAIEAINLDHSGTRVSEKIQEGMVFAGLDPVALDFLCARYMFSNVQLSEALNVDLDDGTGGHFLQSVPIPTLEGNDIVTVNGYDCPISRDRCFASAEKRGLGTRDYYVVGYDGTSDSTIVSLKGHLGRIENGSFVDITTETLYFDVYKMPWDMQRTSLGYFDAVDMLTGSSIKKDFLGTFDESGKGIIKYGDFGRNGVSDIINYSAGMSTVKMVTKQFGYLEGAYTLRTLMLKYNEADWNSKGLDMFKEQGYGAVCITAFQMSRIESENPDPFLPGLTWGQGKWPSYQLARHVNLGMSLYGEEFPNKISILSLYGIGFHYADLTQNNGKYSGGIQGEPSPEALEMYFSDLLQEKKELLDFTFYVPDGYDNVGGLAVPNVVVTADPELIFTSIFEGGREVWPEVGL